LNVGCRSCMLLASGSGEEDMETGELQKQFTDTQISSLIDNILDSVLALKARLADSNRDSNSLGGILIRPTIQDGSTELQICAYFRLRLHSGALKPQSYPRYPDRSKLTDPGGFYGAHHQLFFHRRLLPYISGLPGCLR
jgi:hypothetical protein